MEDEMNPWKVASELAENRTEATGWNSQPSKTCKDCGANGFLSSQLRETGIHHKRGHVRWSNADKAARRGRQSTRPLGLVDIQATPP